MGKIIDFNAKKQEKDWKEVKQILELSDWEDHLESAKAAYLDGMPNESMFFFTLAIVKSPEGLSQVVTDEINKIWDELDVSEEFVAELHAKWGLA